MKLKSKCCKSFKKQGKACKSCPLVFSLDGSDLCELAGKIKKKKARKKFEARYLEA